jgi:hypothetical protein
MFSQIAGAVRRIDIRNSAISPLEQMNENVTRVVDVLEDNRELTIILLREAVGLDADFDQKLSNFYQRLSAIVEGALRLGQEMGLVRACDVRLMSHCIIGSMKEVMLRRLTSNEPPEVLRDYLARELLQYNLRGIFL